MPLTKDERKKLDETHDTVNKLKTTLVGMNGDEGLVGDFKKVAESHYKLRRNFYLLLGVLIGSGILTGSIIAALSG